MTRVYFALWGLVALAAVVVFIMGGMSMLALVIFGTIAFGLTFMGMMGVLPFVVTHPSAGVLEPAKPARKPITAAAAQKVTAAVGSFFEHNPVDVRKPRHP